MFLSGNEMYWRTRYEPSTDAERTPYRTLVSYKETWANEKIDPAAEWTGTWRDPRFAPAEQGAGLPENALTGTAYMANFTTSPLTVTRARGQAAAVAAHTGLEATTEHHDRARARTPSATSRTRTWTTAPGPPGLIRLSTTTGAVPEYLSDFGNTVVPRSTTHHMTMYRAASGALVFSAGTVQWTWGLDDEHDGPFARSRRTLGSSRRRSTCSRTWAPSRRR